MIKNMNKISIIGGPGTGKTTLGDNLSKELKIPVYHLDGIHHLENWKTRDSKERDEIILKIIEESKWIIDGTYKSTLEERVKSSDMVIFLNYSMVARLKGIFSRYLKNRGKEKKEIPGCKEKMDFTFIKFTFSWNKTKGYEIKEILKKHKDKNVLVFKNRAELKKWYKKEFNKTIEKYFYQL